MKILSLLLLMCILSYSHATAEENNIKIQCWSGGVMIYEGYTKYIKNTELGMEFIERPSDELKKITEGTNCIINYN